MMEYLGAREVRVPWTTAETHSAPKRAFQKGTVTQYLDREFGNQRDRREMNEEQYSCRMIEVKCTKMIQKIR